MPSGSARQAARDVEIRTSSESARDLAERFGLSREYVNRIRAHEPRQYTPTRKERHQLEVVEGGWAAACMEPAEWADWLRHNPRLLEDSQFADRPCRDCPLGFAADMRAIGRCNGTPGATQEDSELDDVMDRLPSGPAPDAPSLPVEAPRPRGNPGNHPLPPGRAERDAVVFEALRSTSSVRLASERLHVSETRVGQILRQVRADGGLPEDVRLLLQLRRGVPGPTSVDRHSSSTTATIEPRSAKPRATQREPLKHPVQNEIGNIPPPDSTRTPVAAAIAEPPDPPQPSPAVLLPCEGCIHAIVCSIKPGLERWAETLAAPVSPHSAISVGAIAVSCIYERAEA